MAAWIWVLAAAALSAAPRAGEAQLAARSFSGSGSPSLSAPSQSIGKFQGSFGQARSYERSQDRPPLPMPRASVGLGRQAGRGAGGRARPTVYRFPGGGGTQFLAPAENTNPYAVQFTHTRSGFLLPSIGLMTLQGTNPLLRGEESAVGRAQTRFSSWGSPEFVARRPSLSLPDAPPAEGAEGSSGESRLTMQELVKNQLDARRQIYEARARRAFEARELHEACDQLILADTTVLDDPQRRIYFKMFFVYAAIAAEQFQEAGNALSWILNRDVATGSDLIPGVLNQFRDVAALYAQARDFNDDATVLELYAAGPLVRQSPIASALRAMMAWGANDPANAKFFARQLADEARRLMASDPSLANNPQITSWLRLYDYLHLADPSGEPVSVAPPSTQPAPVPSVRQGPPSEAGRPQSLTIRGVPLTAP